MADIDDVLIRMGADPAFRDQVQTDPRSALDSYQLSNDDLSRIQGHFEPPDAGPTVRSLFEDTGRPRRLAGLRGLLIPALAVAGAVLGTTAGAAGLAGGGDGEDAFTLAPTVASVAVGDCPGAEGAGMLHSGDRVFAVGRDATGDWIQLRDPAAPTARVWAPAEAAEVNGDLNELPVTSCYDPADETATDPSEVAATTPVDEPPSTTDPGAPTTTAAPGAPTTATTRPGTPSTSPVNTTVTTATTPTTAGPGTTATTAPPDTTPPALSGAGAQPATIWESAPGLGGPCAAAATNRTTISATASDPSGVTMSMTYRVGTGATSGPVAMTAGASGSFQGTLGPFPAGTVPDGSVSTVTVTVRATDSRNNTTTAATTFKLHSASECIG